MDVTDLVHRLLGRWRAAVLVVLVAVLASATAWVGAGSSQESSAAVVIVPPTLGDAVSDQNPLLNLDNNLAQLATVLASAMSSQDVTDQLAAEDATAPYTISTVTGTNPSFAQLSPQVVFTVTAASADLATRTSTALVAAAQDRLDDLQTQAGASDAAKARLVTVVAPTAAVSAGSGRLRAAGAVGLGVTVLGLLGLLLVDELLARRSSRTDWLADDDPDVAVDTPRQPHPEPEPAPVSAPEPEPLRQAASAQVSAPAERQNGSPPRVPSSTDA